MRQIHVARFVAAQQITPRRIVLQLCQAFLRLLEEYVFFRDVTDEELFLLRQKVEQR